MSRRSPAQKRTTGPLGRLRFNRAAKKGHVVGGDGGGQRSAAAGYSQRSVASIMPVPVLVMAARSEIEVSGGSVGTAGRRCEVGIERIRVLLVHCCTGPVLPVERGAAALPVDLAVVPAIRDRPGALQKIVREAKVDA